MTDVQDTLPENASDATSDQALKINVKGPEYRCYLYSDCTGAVSGLEILSEQFSQY